MKKKSKHPNTFIQNLIEIGKKASPENTALLTLQVPKPMVPEAYRQVQAGIRGGNEDQAANGPSKKGLE